MTPEQKEELKDSIHERIAELEASVEKLKDSSKTVELDGSIGRVTRMDAIQIQRMQEGQLKVTQANILTLKESIQKIDEGTFGKCLYCKKQIGFERLKALPESKTCIECAEKYGR